MLKLPIGFRTEIELPIGFRTEIEILIPKYSFTALASILEVAM